MRGIGIVLEETVCDRAQAVVGARQRLAHRVDGPRIVEAGQQDQRAIPHITVGMLGHRAQQGGHGLRSRRPADGARSCRACRVVEIAQLVDGGLKLRRRNGLRRGRFLPACRTLTEKTDETH